jgi:hypothetical protein
MIVYHSDCSRASIPLPADAKIAMRACQEWISIISEHGEAYNLDSLFKGYNEGVDLLQAEYKELVAKFDTAEKEDDLDEFLALTEEAFKLKETIDKSQVIRWYKKHKSSTELQQRLRGWNSEEVKKMIDQQILQKSKQEREEFERQIQEIELKARLDKESHDKSKTRSTSLAFSFTTSLLCLPSRR